MELPVSIRQVRTRREEPVPYPASWVNNLTAVIERLRGPAWCYYLVAILIAVATQLAIAWWEGRYRHGIIAFAVVLTGSSIYYLAMIHYLDQVAADAVKKFCPSMAVSEQQVAELAYQLTHLPARTVRIITLVGVALALLIITGIEQGYIHTDLGYFGTSTAAQLWWRAVVVFDQIFFWNLIYHTIHQLRIVNLVYEKHAKIDLFNLAPLYTFSRLTTYTALSTLLIAYLWVATFPWLSNDFIVIGSWLIGIAAALAGFVLPLLGIHRRLVEEKQRWKVEAGQSLKLSIANFHLSIAERRLEDVDLLLKAIEGANRQQLILEQIPTWPWQPGTLRGVMTTVVVPIFLWLVLRVLEHIMVF